MNDLSKNPEYVAKMAELKAEFKVLQKEMGDTLDLDNPVVPKKKSRKRKK
jgi:hypothetical protein